MWKGNPFLCQAWSDTTSYWKHSLPAYPCSLNENARKKKDRDSFKNGTYGNNGTFLVRYWFRELDRQINRCPSWRYFKKAPLASNDRRLPHNNIYSPGGGVLGGSVGAGGLLTNKENNTDQWEAKYGLLQSNILTCNQDWFQASSWRGYQESLNHFKQCTSAIFHNFKSSTENNLLPNLSIIQGR